MPKREIPISGREPAGEMHHGRAPEPASHDNTPWLLERARADERAAIARELHDEFAQLLTSLKLDLQWLARKLPGNDASVSERVREMDEAVGQMFQCVRDISACNRPDALSRLGLGSAIQWHLERFRDQTGAACYCDVAELHKLRLDPQQETAVYRIFQEALTNIARHADADRVGVSAHINGRQLELQICDNGRGIQSESMEGMLSQGLANMRARARECSGTIDIRSFTSGGTRVLLRLPLADNPPD